MLGGVEITDKVRESAREMKELAAKKEKNKNSKKRPVCQEVAGQFG